MMAVDFYAADAATAAAIWQEASFGALFAMWLLMMAAMMLPSFLPTAHLFSRLAAKRNSGVRFGAGALTVGYTFVWAAFSLAAALAQQQAAAAGALNETLALSSPLLGGALLVAAGLFQLTPVKFSCLKGCRHPAFFFMLNWRSGRFGAIKMGAHNGVLCLGCCWALMALLFVGGVMDLRWIIALSLYAAAEKLLPLPPHYLARFSAVVLIAAGGWLLLGGNSI